MSEFRQRLGHAAGPVGFGTHVAAATAFATVDRGSDKDAVLGAHVVNPIPGIFL